ncbi:MAG: hypothetical protein LC132_08625, partial [Burkholderiales bacterium]|nr:hypothetical protein [Burkholderiales bacterium]
MDYIERNDNKGIEEAKCQEKELFIHSCTKYTNMEYPRTIVAEGEDLLQYLPHRPPVLLVDTFFGRERYTSYTGYTPHTGSLFCPGDYFLEEGLLEHAAQSIALAAGLERVQNQGQVEPGFVGSVNSFITYR